MSGSRPLPTRLECLNHVYAGSPDRPFDALGLGMQVTAGPVSGRRGSAILDDAGLVLLVRELARLYPLLMVAAASGIKAGRKGRDMTELLTRTLHSGVTPDSGQLDSGQVE